MDSPLKKRAPSGGAGAERRHTFVLQLRITTPHYGHLSDPSDGRIRPLNGPLKRPFKGPYKRRRRRRRAPWLSISRGAIHTEVPLDVFRGVPIQLDTF